MSTFHEAPIFFVLRNKHASLQFSFWNKTNIYSWRTVVKKKRLTIFPQTLRENALENRNATLSEYGVGGGCRILKKHRFLFRWDVILSTFQKVFTDVCYRESFVTFTERGFFTVSTCWNFMCVTYNFTLTFEFSWIWCTPTSRVM